LGIDPEADFEDCHGNIYNWFANDISIPYDNNYSYILSQDIYPINVMLYNGQDDIICNTAGSLDWIYQMSWSGMVEFRQ